MKAFTICTAMAIFATLSHAAPSEVKTRQTDEVLVTFQGAPPDVAYFTQYFPTDGSYQYIDNKLSISHIEVPYGASCTFFGVDNSVTTVNGPDTVDVGPPQTQYAGYCYAS